MGLAYIFSFGSSARKVDEKVEVVWLAEAA
jgi:hypothetical protein